MSDVITDQALQFQQPFAKAVPTGLIPWTTETAKRDGAIGGSRVTQAKKDAAKLSAMRRVIKQTGDVTEESKKFLLNFLMSGDTARSQVVELCRKLNNDLDACDPEKVGGSRARVADVLLKAAEHQHGRAAIKSQVLNVQLDLSVSDLDKTELLEQLDFYS